MSGVEKACILTLVIEGYSMVEICKSTGRFVSTIQCLKIAAAGLPEGMVPQHKLIPGPSNATDRLMRHELLQNPTISAAELKKSHHGLLGHVSTRTIQDRLKRDLKMSSRSPAKKTLLTMHMMKKRLCFAKQF